ncbi:MAG: hypothetical protein G01um101420_78 [Parcubacteria group bacterium Gr01-1014_20]|nr:MAG: hypothetical protein G01um101420_78 [Parcubacteria group bacterium Gr01-1014_20]
MNPSPSSSMTELRQAELVHRELVRPTLRSAPRQEAYIVDLSVDEHEDPSHPASAHSENETSHSEPTHPMSGEELVQNGYTSSIPWVNAKADCLVVSCSDHRFEDQTREFLIHGLGFQNPHVLQWPSGVTIASGLAVLTGSLPKAFDLLFQKALRITHATTLILVAHEDCGAYKDDDLVNRVARRFTGKSVREIQIMHLQDAVTALRPTLRGVIVRGFYADVIPGTEGEHVNFKEVSVVHS